MFRRGTRGDESSRTWPDHCGAAAGSPGTRSRSTTTSPPAWTGPLDEPVPHSNVFDVADNRIDIVLADGGTSSLWWATKNEWLGLIDVAGLELEALYGDFDRSPVTASSREYVFVAVRP
jgi:hypothetical protein